MWFKIDDSFYDHPKVENLEPSAVGLWTLCGTYAARHLTDGFVAAGRVRRFGGTDADAQALVDAGLWQKVADGYQFHDWEDHQPMRKEVEENRERERERKRNYRRGKNGQYVPRNEMSQWDTTRTSGGTPTDVRPESHQPDPTRPDPTIEVPKGTSTPSPRKAPAKQLPADWAPTDAHTAKATEKGLNLAQEAEAFKLHAEANGRTAVNWNAAFSMWLTKATPRGQQYTPARPVVGQSGNWMNLSRKAPQ